MYFSFCTLHRIKQEKFFYYLIRNHNSVILCCCHYSLLFCAVCALWANYIENNIPIIIAISANSQSFRFNAFNLSHEMIENVIKNDLKLSFYLNAYKTVFLNWK